MKLSDFNLPPIDYVTIYALAEPLDNGERGTVRYVGKTNGFVWHRIRSHFYAARRGDKRPVLQWIRETNIERGLGFSIIHLERVPFGQDWQERERYWIAKYRAEVPSLLNVTDGGEGTFGLEFSEHHRAAIAAALRTGADCYCEVCGKGFWRKRHQILAGQNRFCSRRCYQIFQVGKKKGQLHVA